MDVQNCPIPVTDLVGNQRKVWGNIQHECHALFSCNSKVGGTDHSKQADRLTSLPDKMIDLTALIRY